MMAVSLPHWLVCKERDDSVYPMYFGASCAFVALQLLSTAKGPIIHAGQWATIADRMLQGSTQLLGLLLWKAQGEAMEGRTELLNKLKKAEKEVAELKRIRREDAKANEKVVGIIATKEQSWISERKRLKQQIQALLNDLRTLETKKGEIISNLNERMEEREHQMQSKDKALDEEVNKRKELEDRLRMVESVGEELRETAKREAQEYSSELWKHKTAFVELVSNQRQLEAEMGCAIQQVEETKQELDMILKQREESVSIIQKLSLEMINMKKDSEQKEKILSAMLRKSNLDTAEKHALLKEVKISKARRKQAELETERWRAQCEKGLDKHLRSNLVNRADSRSEMFFESKRVSSVEAGCSHLWTQLPPIKNRKNHGTLIDYLEIEHRKEHRCISKRTNHAAEDHFNRYSSKVNGKFSTDAKHLEDWIGFETENYTSTLEQRHHAEINAFSEQMRLKDEKLKSFHWQLLSMELESKRLQSHIEGLEENLSQLRGEKNKLEALFLDKETEFKWSEVKIIKTNVSEKEQEPKLSSVSVSHETENDIAESSNQEALAKETSSERPLGKEGKGNESIDVDISNQLRGKFLTGSPEQLTDELQREDDPSEDQLWATRLEVQALVENRKEKALSTDVDLVQDKDAENKCQEKAGIVVKCPSAGNCFARKASAQKIDLHALGVSYKIKRLKQQLIVLEKLTATQAVKKTTSKNHASNTSESNEKRKGDLCGQQTKDFLRVMPLLNKHLKRYQTLEEMTDDLCMRMHNNGQEVRSRDSSTVRTKEQTEMLEQFLEEAFHLQCYMVATGQKLAELQSTLACSFSVAGEGLNKSAGLNVRQFEDHIQVLFREIQRGLELRIAQIIGDIEGTLAYEGIMNARS